MAQLQSVSSININKYMNCEECKRFAVIPLYSCPTCNDGNIMCGICNETGGKLCTRCKTTLQRNGFLEFVLNSERTVIPCRNDILGCKIRVHPKNMKHHLSLSCDFRPQYCRELTCDNKCGNKMYNPKQLFLHWKDYHKMDLLTGKINSSLIYSVFKVQLAFFEEPDYRWKPSYFEYDDHKFYLHIVGKRGLIYAWITSSACEFEANKYTFSLAVNANTTQKSFNSTPQLIWKDLPIHSPQYYDFDRITNSGHLVVFYCSALKHFEKATCHDHGPFGPWEPPSYSKQTDDNLKINQMNANDFNSIWTVWTIKVELSRSKTRPIAVSPLLSKIGLEVLNAQLNK